MSTGSCSVCSAPIDPGDRFCEACGTPLDPGAGAEVDPAGTPASNVSAESSPSTESTESTRSSAVIEEPMSAGLDPAVGTERIERRRPVAVGPVDHRESDLLVAAAVSDRGLRHARNEDAFGLAVTDGRAAAVVCDGVSTTVAPERASNGAARAALSVLEPALAATWWPDTERAAKVLVDAVETAQRVVAEVGRAEAAAGLDAPSTTIVAALVGPGQAVVANVGDSRAYWVATGSTGNVVLTVDDSWATEAIALGVDPDDAYADPQAHVITRWLGADAESSTPTVRAIDLDAEGAVIVCTDGLWNYFPAADDLRSLVAGVGFDRPPLDVAQELVAAALAAGGHDNVTVAVIPSHPSGGTPEPSRE